MPAKLFLLSGSEVEPEPPFAISESDRVTVGRGETADFVLLDREVSREHFHISHDGRGFILEDLGSINGTVVNGDRVVQPVPLHDGDTIQAGATQLRFALTAEAAEGAAGGAAAEVVEAAEAKVVRIPLAPLEEAPRRWRSPRVHPDHTVRHFFDKHPRDTANKVFRWWQLLWYVVILLGAFVLLNYNPLRFLHVFHVFCSFYLIVIAYKLLAVFLSVVKRGEIAVSPSEVAALKDDELPVYTLLVPLYKETEVASKITRYIARLDYPQHKLDVKLLLEEDDAGTLEVCRSAKLPANYEILICPDSKPKTKPKACNHGLERARGDYLVIYDAEDRPEPDQLKKAVVAFRKANAPRTGLARLFRRKAETVCLQAKLNYYNPNQNLLTKWFTIEYTTWFDLFLPGLHRLGSPIPLGGTSNHFKTQVLQHIGGWDPFNVTEDCDLGIRLHKMGYSTQVLDSTTWEEANSRPWNWVRQRSRWVKGYIQTHLVHMRNPFATLWRLGPAGMFGFLNSVGGLSLMLLLNPIFWLVLLFYAACWTHDLSLCHWSPWLADKVHEAFNTTDDTRRVSAVMMIRARWGNDPAIEPMIQENVTDLKWPWSRWAKWDRPWVWRMWFNDPRGNPFWNRWSQVFFIITAVLFFGNFFFILMHVWACLRRKLTHLIPHAIFMPIYWIFISLGAWKGFLQLFFRPFKWEKTLHGLDAPGAPPRPAPVPATPPPDGSK